MAPGVQLRDGVEIEFASGERIVCDGVAAGTSTTEVTTVVSHAHGDHLVDTASEIVASELTAALASVRQSECDPETITHPAVDLIPAGHIAGSRAVLLTDPETDRRYLYTGDCRLSDRLYLDGFDPVDADVLILETTYGDPTYRFPAPEKTQHRIREWLAQTMDDVVILFGYALGRAQKLQVLLESTARSRVFITDAIVLSDHCDYDELIELVTTVDPERVYTQHGFTETFATRLTRKYGYQTQALKSNQSTLGDF